jgi:hypothetical protein
MGRGGARAGAGRKKGSTKKFTEQAIERAGADGLLPLEFMLDALRDVTKPFEVRMDAAKSAAPYIHPRLSQVDASVTRKRDVTDLTTDELDELIAAELASGEASEEGGPKQLN